MAIEYKTTTYRTVESANDNATYCWVELSTSHIPQVNGQIKRIVIQGANTSASGMTTDPVYLGLWERQGDGGLISLGCSKNTVVQAINQESVWDFDGAFIRGKSLLLGLLSSPDEAWNNNTPLLLRSRVQTADTDGCVILTDIGRKKVTPDITFTIEYAEYVPDDEPEPEPEPEANIRKIDILTYLPPIDRERKVFQQIAVAENPEFNNLQDSVYRIIDNAFILSSDEYGVSRRETILNLIPETTDTLDDRKNSIIEYLKTKPPYTFRYVKRMIADIVGEDFTMKYDNEIATLTIILNDNSKMDAVKSLLDRVLPMHIVYNIK